MKQYKKYYLHFLFLAVFNFLIFGAFLLKKQYIVGNDLILLEWGGLLDNFRPDLIRLLSRIYFSLMFHFFKLNANIYLLFNVTVHLINVYLIFILFKKITKRTDISFIASLFFTVHYMHSGVTLHVYFMSELMACMFALICILLFIKFKEKLHENIKKTAYIFYILSLFSFLLSLFSRASYLYFPIIILCYDFMWNKEKTENKKIYLRNFLFFLFSGIYAFFSVFVFKYAENAYIRLNFIINNPKAIIINCINHINLVLIPFDFRNNFKVIGYFQSHNFLLSFFLFLSFLAVIIYIKNKFYKFGLILLLISSLYMGIASKDFILDKHFYTQLIGASFIMSLIIVDISERFKFSLGRFTDQTFKFIFTLGIIFPLFISLKAKQDIRTQVGHTVDKCYKKILDTAFSKSNQAVIYAFNFPMYIKKCPAFSENLLTGIIHYEKLNYFVDAITVDRRCRINRIPSILYKMLINSNCPWQKIRYSRGFWFPYDNMYGIPDKGIDNCFPASYPKFVFLYNEGNVIDLTSKLIPQTEVKFKIKSKTAENISIIGDFNCWDKSSDKLKKTTADIWQGSIFLSPGLYNYQFLINSNKRIAYPYSKFYNNKSQGRCSVLTIDNPVLPVIANTEDIEKTIK